MTALYTSTKHFLTLAVLVLVLASCSKEEVLAPGAQPGAILKSGGADDQNRILPEGVSNPADIVRENGEEQVGGLNGITRDFEDGEDGGPDGGGISDDGDDEGDKEKSNKKPRVN